MKKTILSAFCRVIIAAFAVMGFSGCVIANANFSDFGTVRGKGDRENFEFKVSEYNAIKIEGAFEIHYFAALSDTVTLSVQPNLREYYTVDVINNELVVRTTKNVSFANNRCPVLTVSTPVLNRLALEGACDFTAHNKIVANSLALIMSGMGTARAELNADSLSANISGAGDFKLSGNADTVYLTLAGTGELDALALLAREATVNLSGAGTIKVNCSHSLNINADGVGSVEYKGSPSLNLSRGGLVSIKQLN